VIVAAFSPDGNYLAVSINNGPYFSILKVRDLFKVQPPTVIEYKGEIYRLIGDS